MIKVGIVLFIVFRLVAQPPPPQTAAVQSIGRQHPYMTTASMLVTQTVTTVYDFKFLRVIDITPTSAETNYAFLRSNTVSIVTNVSSTSP